jgi:hypothetical protein
LSFEGWIGRPNLIPQLARSGALIHPASTKKQVSVSPKPHTGNASSRLGPRRSFSDRGAVARDALRARGSEAPKRRPVAWRRRLTPSWPTLPHPSRVRPWEDVIRRRGVERAYELALQRVTDHPGSPARGLISVGSPARPGESELSRPYGRERSPGSRSSGGGGGPISESPGIARRALEGAVS